MNCLKCKYLSIGVVGTSASGKPYIYCCQKSNFISIESTNTLGKSSVENGKVCYTKEQYNDFIANKKFCINRLDFNNAEFWSITISLFAFIFSIINFYNSSQNNKQNEIDTYSKTEIEKFILIKIDSTINSSEKFPLDGLKETSNNE